jgi:hypothetical protein
MYLPYLVGTVPVPVPVPVTVPVSVSVTVTVGTYGTYSVPVDVTVTVTLGAAVLADFCPRGDFAPPGAETLPRGAPGTTSF